MIDRNNYLQKLVNKIGNDSIKIITGLRRVGKSYLLNTIFNDYLLKNITDDKHIIKFSFDSADDLKKIDEDLVELEAKNRKVDYKKFMNYISTKIIDDSKYFMLLDEVQRLECFETILNGYLAKQNIEIYVTGSNSKFLSSDVITEFRGRGDEIHVWPLSFEEYYNYVNKDFDIAIYEYMTYGGLPRTVLANNEEEKVNYLESQLKKTYLKDIVERYKVQNNEELDYLLSIIASGISNLTNPNKLASYISNEKKIHLTADTIKKFIGYYEDAFLINQSLRYDIKGKSYISTPYKLYFEDLGLRNAKLDFRQNEYTHLMENLIYNELKMRGYLVDVGQVEIRENGIKKMIEIDFVANKGSKRYYIQSTYSIPDDAKMNQELRPFNNVYDSFKKIIVVKDNIIKYQNSNGYLFIGLKEFLLNKNSLDF